MQQLLFWSYGEGLDGRGRLDEGVRRMDGGEMDEGGLDGRGFLDGV